MCLATKQEGQVKKWNIRQAEQLILHADAVFSNDEKLYIPYIDYLGTKNASLGLFKQELP